MAEFRNLTFTEKMKCIIWNIEWTSESSLRGKHIKKLIKDADPDLLCLTEATLEMIPKNGYVIESDPNYGYPNKGNRRKVLLWSKQPWQEVDTVGSKSLPSGRFVTGITGGFRFVGVCIPWRDAHVRTGRKDRALWQDHLQYLDGFTTLADAYCTAGLPVCVIGDFNQRIPRSRQPQEVAQRLSRAFNIGWKIATAGITDDEGKPLIDHVASCGPLVALVDQIIPKKSSTGLHLSDHVGIITSIIPAKVKN
jgi:exonuclease III